MKPAENPDGMYLGICYRQERPTYEEQLQAVREKNYRAGYDLPDILKRFKR